MSKGNHEGDAVLPEILTLISRWFLPAIPSNRSPTAVSLALGLGFQRLLLS